MSSFPILDLVVGMIFIFFLLSIISSSAVEMIMTVRKIRSKILGEWLFTIFDKTITQPDGTTLKLGQAIMDHCSVTALSKPGSSPSYIDAKNFTSALLEKITFDPANPKSIAADLNSMIGQLEKTNALSTEFQRVLLTYAKEAEDSLQEITEKTVSGMELFRTKVENWYDSSMDRITGTLKKKYSRPFTIIVAISVALLLNADSISISKYLYSNPDARAKLAAQAYTAAKDSISKYEIRLNQVKAAPETLANMEEIKNEMKTSLENINDAKAALEGNVPLGWNGKVFNDIDGHISGWLILSKIVGLAGTVLAIMMGAPFWFDMLNKISNLRSSGNPPSSSTDDGTKKK